MEKIVLEYERSTGQLKDAAGIYLNNTLGLVSFEPVQVKMPVQDVIDLKAAGFDVEEIAAMRRKGII